MSHFDLINSIVSNPSKHLVNREEKMEASVDAMVNNINKLRASNDKKAIGEVDYGYNKKTGRKTGD